MIYIYFISQDELNIMVKFTQCYKSKPEG